MEKVRVLVAERQSLVREGLCALLRTCEDIDVIGQAGNGKQALEMIAAENPDVVLLDTALPPFDGAGVARRIGRGDKRTRVLFLSDGEDRERILRGIKAGGDGFILKEAPADDLFSAIGTVHKGGYFLYPSVAKDVVEDYLSLGRGRKPDPYDRLSDREKEVLRLLAEGRATRTIAQILEVPLAEVQRDRVRLMKKLEIHSQAEAIRYAIQKHL